MALCLILLFSCEKDDSNDDDSNTEITNPVKLTGYQTENLILEDHIDGSGPDYYVINDWVIRSDVEIQPGVHIMIKEGATIEIDAEGSFNATGTEEAPIVIYGEVQNAGYWDAIKFDDSNNPQNKMIHVHISDGGGDVHYGMVSMTNNSMLEMNNSVISNSAKYGLYLSTGDESLPDFFNNTISACASCPIRLRCRQLHYLDASTDFSGNSGDSYVEVETGDVEGDVTWKKLAGPVVFKSGYNNIYGDVSVEPGAVLLMGSGAKIIIEPEGSLNMEGTQAEPITIKGEVESPGYWEMISFDNSNNPLNKLSHVNISHGGDFGEANVWCGGSTRIEIANSSFNYSANYGIYLGRNVTFINGGGNTFTGNAADDIYLQP